jgi:hypothetical protein
MTATTSEQSESRTPLYRRKGVVIAAIIVGLVAMAVAWWLLSPLFINRTVIEDFPRAAVAEVPEDMSLAEVEEAMVAAEDTEVSASDPMPEMTEPVVLVSGEIRGADSFHQGTGTASIYQLDDGSRVLRLESLDVTNGPDLHVYLSPVSAPRTSDEVTTPGYIDLGGLKGNRGDQNYEIPADYELPEELSVVIYCVPFHVIFSTATLR